MDPQLDAPPAAHSWLGPPIDARPLFVPEHAALIATLRELTPADWEREAVPGWSVRDVTAHVLADCYGRLARHRDGQGEGGREAHREGGREGGGEGTGTAPDGGNWSLAGPADGHPAALVRLDAETAWRLCVRGIEPADALTRAEIEGDRQLAEAACRIVSVVH
ncbi:maleylpyruvate isomerase N-terminal domain-containing protein [Streptomyces chartreusis]|uniref:maleylpyruvate isomerase N-terminal domain-containing protein n=1 Tax=Streptomyces chartreusis TaxID=1969 RepID=UPI00368ACB45